MFTSGTTAATRGYVRLNAGWLRPAAPACHIASTAFRFQREFNPAPWTPWRADFVCEISLIASFEES